MKTMLKSRRFWVALIAVLAVGIIATVMLGGRGSPTTAEAKTGDKMSDKMADGKPKEEPPLEFVAADLAYATPRALTQTLSSTGTLQATHQAVVKAKAAVDVKAMLVREGDTVKAGQQLAKLDTADLEARVAERVSTRESAKAQFELADKTRTSNQRLLEKNFISQNAFDNAESIYKANLAALKAAEAQLDVAKIALDQAKVLAPINGIVAKRYIQLGEKTAVDAALFTIVDLDTLEMQALIPAADVARLAPGMAAKISADGLENETFEARLDRISPATEPGTRSIVVFLTVSNTSHRLKSGMFATAIIRQAASDPVPALPATAVLDEAGQAVIWTVENNKLMRRPVVIGRRDAGAGYVEIRSGVGNATPVLVTRFENLKEGAVALLKPASATGATPAASSAQSDAKPQTKS